MENVLECRLARINSIEMTAVVEATMSVCDQAVISFALIVDRQWLRLMVDGVFICLSCKIMSSERSH